ncbi:MAG: formate dehydrogenase accessory sulfurtransferase FdhD [Saprospiraceae bacterium]|nr:formate dehydrogenase accessory sulfurtransferase FdhD [Saprospiraceae bacterium]
MVINDFVNPNLQSGISNINIIKWNSGEFHHENDKVAMEEPLEIVAKYQLGKNTIHKPISVTMRTPGDDYSLIIGFLYNEGLITSLRDVIDIEFRYTCDGEAQDQQTAIVSLSESVIPRITSLERHFYTNSSCGVCGKTAIDLAMQHIAYVPKSLDGCLTSDQITIAPEILKTHQKLFHETGGIHASGILI